MQYENSDLEIVNLIAMAYLTSLYFAVGNRFSIDLLVCWLDGKTLFILPTSGGFNLLLIKELQSIPLFSHLGAQKLLDAI